ncbi:phage protease [Xanthobacter sp. DSM 24535]|uniref:phage protease n=1 Tax=Roseixanthobacter psychrophilus TaxID=3119917 RepID=UPI003727C8AA
MHDVLLFSAFPASDPVPEWVHLIPAGTFSGTDGRGPYVLADPQKVIAASMAGGKLAIDENHAIDLSAPKGGPSPARGWVVEMQARTDGIWGRVEWTGAGTALMQDKAYLGISPALYVDRRRSPFVVAGMARASLVNTPNLTALTSLHRSQQMDFITQARQALGLAADASEAAVLAAIDAQKISIDRHAAQTNAIATAAGLTATADPVAIVTELQSRQLDGTKLAAVKAGLATAGLDFEKVSAAQIELHLKNTGGTAAESQLRSTVIELQTRLENLSLEAARKEAVLVIDGAIKAGMVSLKPLRDHYIDRHMADPVAVALEIAAMPNLHSGGLRQPPSIGSAANGGNAASLTPDERRTCVLMGIDPAEYAKTLKSIAMETI